MLLADTLKKAHKLFPRKEAIVCGGKRWTYGEFFDRIRRLSSFLKDAGIEKGDRVAVLHPNCHYFLETYYAVAVIGAVCVPLNHRLSRGEIVFILQDAGVKTLVVHPRFSGIVDRLRADIPTLETIIWTGDGGNKDRNDGRDVSYEDILGGAPGPLPEAAVGDDDVAQLYYTSGTTGRPKGVMLTHRNVMVHALGAIAELQLTDRDVWLHAAPLFHLADAWATWAITWTGGAHVLGGDFDPATVLSTMGKEKITITNLIPTMLNLMVNHPGADGFDYRSLRVILSGGAPIAPEVVRRIIAVFGCEYVQTYGMTETSPYLTLSLLKDHLRRLPPEEQLRFQAKTGREFISVELRVVNDAGHDVRRDEKDVGEIVVRGDSVTKGYWNLPEETAKAIRDGWLYTGDMAVMDEERYVTIVDRRKDMILSGGENIYSTEVENVLYLHPAVLECCVIGVPDEKWGEAVKGIVVLKAGQAARAEEVILFCKERIAPYKAPKTIDFLAALPKTGSGKIEKKKLRDAFWRGLKKV